MPKLKNREIWGHTNTGDELERKVVKTDDPSIREQIRLFPNRVRIVVIQEFLLLERAKGKRKKSTRLMQ